MESPLRVPVSSGACGTCSTAPCSTCGPARPNMEAPALLSRRDFGRTMLAASAGALFIGCTDSSEQAAAPPTAKPDSLAAAASKLSPDLAVVQKSKGTIMTTLDEFYKMGPGPSSSHTMGPMRITYDFFQRVSKLPEADLKRATRSRG